MERIPTYDAALKRNHELYGLRKPSLGSMPDLIPLKPPRISETQRLRLQHMYSPRKVKNNRDDLEDTMFVPCRWKPDGWKMVNRSSEQLHLHHPNKKNVYRARDIPNL
jgi:hypothetical protein